MRRRLGGLWQNRDFLRLWAGQSVSEAGSQVTVLALPTAAIVIFDAGPGQVGVLAALQMFPPLLLGLVGGVWLDRVRRRPVMVDCDIARLVTLGSVPLAFALGVLTIAQLYVVAFVSGSLTVLFNVAYQSYLPSLVGRSQLGEGNSKLISTRSIAEVVGPGLGGLAVQTVGGARAIALDAGSFLISALAVWSIRTTEPSPVTPEHRATFSQDLREGLRTVACTPTLRRLA